MRTRLVASLTSEPSVARLEELSSTCDWLELRADRVGDLPAEALRRSFPGRLLYTLRSVEEGGGERGEERARRLAAAATGFDLVDLEASRDLEPEILDAVPEAKRLLSWHGEAEDVASLRQRLEAMSGHPARFYKLVPEATEPSDALEPLALLATAERDDVIAFSSGRNGVWSRLLAPHLGSAAVFGAADPTAGAEPAAPGQPSVRELVRDYGLPALAPVRQLFGIVGNPVLHSLSPRLHNAAYRELGLEALYLPFEADVFGDFWLDVVEGGGLGQLGFPLRGLSVTAPFKQIALAVSGASSPLAERIGSANTLVRRGGVWEAESTDSRGVLDPLQAAGVELRKAQVAVLGAGGAGRAAAFGLAGAGAKVTLVNRGTERGARVARELGVRFLPLAELDASEFRLLVNATPLGTDASGELPFDVSKLTGDAWVVDLGYQRGGPTRLVREATARGARVVDGRQVLLHQARRQFWLMTGEELPEAAAASLGPAAEGPAS